MYVTILAMDKAIDMEEEKTDTEEVFEECMKELVPVAPLAEPEVFMNGAKENTKPFNRERRSVAKPDKRKVTEVNSSVRQEVLENNNDESKHKSVFLTKDRLPKSVLVNLEKGQGAATHFIDKSEVLENNNLIPIIESEIVQNISSTTCAENGISKKRKLMNDKQTETGMQILINLKLLKILKVFEMFVSQNFMGSNFNTQSTFLMSRLLLIT